MNLTPQAIAREVAATGFGAEPLEKVFRLMELIPMLRAGLAPQRGEVSAWAGKLVAECRERLAALLPLNEAELEFLRRLNEEGVINPELVTGDVSMQETIREHPGLQWKAMNVRKHRGLDTAGLADDEA